MSILEMCQWLQDLGWATGIRESTLVFPILEGSHLLGLAVIMGPVLMFDLRLTGLGWRTDPVSKVARTFIPFSLGGALLMVGTGIPLFCSEAVKCYQSGWFRIKVIMLFAALANALYFHLKTQSSWAAWENDMVPPTAARMAGYLSMAFWTLVILAGRWTAYTL